MKKHKFNIGDRVYWLSNIVGRKVYATIDNIGSFFMRENSYIVFEEGTGHKWEIAESKLRKAK